MKRQTPNLKLGKIHEQTLHKKIVSKWPISIRKISKLLVISEIQIKITMMYHNIPVRLVERKRLTISTVVMDVE